MVITTEMKDYLTSCQEELKQLIRDLCAIPAPSHHEERRAVFCKEWFERNGGQDVYIDEALNVVCPLHVTKDNRIVVFMAHTDTVFPDMEPMPLVETDETIQCPGVGDDTANLAIMMICARYFIQHDIASKTGILFVANSCEEGLGNLKGIRAVMERYGNTVTAFFTFDGQYRAVVDRSVGSHRYKVTVRTRGGHSFNDFGNENAARVLAKGIAMIYDIPVPEGGKTTYNVGTISGGTSVNTIVQEASMLCEYRSESSENLDYMKEKFREVFAAMAADAGVEVELVGDRPGMRNVDPAAQKELADLCAHIQQKHGGAEPVRNSGSTDCNIPHSMGIPAVCVGTYLGGGEHTRQEWVDKSSISVGVDIVADIIETYFR